MARFKSGSALNAQLEDLIKNADQFLWLISPYIKLHQRIKAELKLKKVASELKIIIVFGKGENDANKLSYEDASFFKEFADIEIRYEKNLHAKYYASEDGGLVTSMNLYDFSQNNNIECGVWMEAPNSLIGKLTGISEDARVDGEAFKYFNEVIENSELLYKKTAKFETNIMGFQKTYKGSTVDVDRLDAYVRQEENKKESNFSGYKNFDEVHSLNRSTKNWRNANRDTTNVNNYAHNSEKNDSFIFPEKGYCIRTGVEIPFNPQRPFCYQAYSTWSQFSNPDYPENFCHRTGKKSNGKTSFNRPVL